MFKFLSKLLSTTRPFSTVTFPNWADLAPASPSKKRMRGKGKKTLAREAAALAVDQPIDLLQAAPDRGPAAIAEVEDIMLLIDEAPEVVITPHSLAISIPTPEFEVWKTSDAMPAYDGGIHGEVRCSVTHDLIGMRVASNGHVVLDPTGTRASQAIKVARFIYTTYHGALSPLMSVRHRDGNPLNNALDNLYAIRRGKLAPPSYQLAA